MRTSLVVAILAPAALTACANDPVAGQGQRTRNDGVFIAGDAVDDPAARLVLERCTRSGQIDNCSRLPWNVGAPITSPGPAESVTLYYCRAVADSATEPPC